MTGSFLSPRFSSATAYFRAGFCFLRTLTRVCQTVYNSQMHQMLIYFNTEHCIVQFHCTDFVAFHIINSYVCHRYVPPFLSKIYWIVLTVSLIVTKDFFGPGTAPFTRSRLFSASTCTISRFWIVTFLLPI